MSPYTRPPGDPQDYQHMRYALELRTFALREIPLHCVCRNVQGKQILIKRHWCRLHAPLALNGLLPSLKTAILQNYPLEVIVTITLAAPKHAQQHISVRLIVMLFLNMGLTCTCL